MTIRKENDVVARILDLSKNMQGDLHGADLPCPALSASTGKEKEASGRRSRPNTKHRPRSSNLGSNTQRGATNLDPGTSGEYLTIGKGKDQTKTPPLDDNRLVVTGDPTNATSQRHMEECIVGLEDFADILDFMDETFNTQLCRVKANLAKMKKCIAKE